MTSVTALASFHRQDLALGVEEMVPMAAGKRQGGRQTRASLRVSSGQASYARRLQIDLASKREPELFKWFLACLLFGKPIQTEIAEQAYRELVNAGLTSPKAVRAAGWNRLVKLLDNAHYVRYDFSTATKLLEICRELQERYGTVSALLAAAPTGPELSKRLQEFKYVGPVTARIFLREIGPICYRRSKATKR